MRGTSIPSHSSRRGRIEAPVLTHMSNLINFKLGQVNENFAHRKGTRNENLPQNLKQRIHYNIIKNRQDTTLKVEILKSKQKPKVKLHHNHSNQSANRPLLAVSQQWQLITYRYR